MWSKLLYRVSSSSYSLNKAFTMHCHFCKLKTSASSKCNFNAQVFSIYDFQVQNKLAFFIFYSSMEKFPHHILCGKYISEKSSSNLLIFRLNFTLQAVVILIEVSTEDYFLFGLIIFFPCSVTLQHSFIYCFELFLPIMRPWCRLRIVKT